MALNQPRHDAARSIGLLVLLAASVCAAIALVWWFSRPLDEVSAARRRFAELRRQTISARGSRPARAAARGQVLRLQAQARAAAGAEREAFERQAADAEARLAWGDAGTVRAALLSRPLLALTRTGRERATSAAPAGGDAPAAQAADPLAQGATGCRACHVTVETPGYEEFPQPFRTHPNLASYLGPSSPHPADRVACSACHGGRDEATTVAEAGHPLEESGVDVASLDAAASAPRMLVVRQTQAGCATCHAGERYLPGADRLDLALTAFERGGCYACHSAAGFGEVHKRGPDLRRIRGKLTPEWVEVWLRDPRSVKRDAMMPRFWGAQAGDIGAGADVPIGREDEQLIAAVTAYLFSVGEPYAPAVPNPPRGDAARGARTLRDVGCLGCHIVGDEPRAEAGLRRTFGQPLQSLAGKVSYAWLYDWIRRPSRFSPGTLMPDLRLSDREAADIASYLVSLSGPEPARPGDVRRPPDVIRAQARQQAEGLPPALVGTANLDALSGEALHEELGRRVIARLGCFNCHEIRGFENAPRSDVPLGQPRSWSADDIQRLHAARAGADASVGGRPAPVYVPDGPPARELFALALTALTRTSSEPRIAPSPAREIRVTGRALVRRRNCIGCHGIESAGGDFVRLVAEPSLGPPLLTPEGSRVQPEWLRAFLRRPITIRPWLSVRMPTFGLEDADLDRASRYFRVIAPPNAEPGPASVAVTAAAGKELFDLLKCQQCHVLGAIPPDQPTSNLAPDLRMAHERLQPEWILAWLRDPSVILPGTRMPSFWPDYPQSFYPPFDRDGALQLRAIRDHLLTLRGGPSPSR